MAAELAEAGLCVVVLEEGDHHATESFTSSTTGALRSLYREGGATTTLGRTPVAYSEGRCVGGGTVVNGGMAFRAPERVLERWAAATGDRGLSAGRLDDAYSRVERFLSVGPPDPGSVGRDQELLRLGPTAWVGGLSTISAITCIAGAATYARGVVRPGRSSRRWSPTSRER